tara:strand:+ start:9989 stop:10849 length:861 start_codon:yes stop_codon:yes gene_type:complete
MDKDLYLDRIGWRGPTRPDLECLEGLCKAQLTSVPFENFDIHLGVEIRLDAPSLYRKIVRRRRGGFCYELNGLFAWLLREVGFSVELLSSRVMRKGGLGAEFDHMALRVWCEGKPFLVDVGFGDGSTLPLALEVGSSRCDSEATYRLDSVAGQMHYQVLRPDGEVKGYELSHVSREVSEFESMSRHHQSSARSWFTKSRICVLRSEVGTISLIDGVYKRGGDTVATLDSDGEYLQTLRSVFGIDLPRMPHNASEQGLQKLRLQGLVWQERAQRALAMLGQRRLLPQ